MANDSGAVSDYLSLFSDTDEDVSKYVQLITL